MSALVELHESERWLYHEVGIVRCLLSGSESSCHIWGPVTTYQHTGRIAQCRATRPQSMGQFVVLMATCTRTRVRWNCWLVGECISLTAQPRDTNYWTVSPIHLHSTKIKRNVHTACLFHWFLTHDISTMETLSNTQLQIYFKTIFCLEQVTRLRPEGQNRLCSPSVFYICIKGPGIESLWWREFTHPSRWTVRPIQHPTQWVIPGGKETGSWPWPLTSISHWG